MFYKWSNTLTIQFNTIIIYVWNLYRVWMKCTFLPSSLISSVQKNIKYFKCQWMSVEKDLYIIMQELVSLAEFERHNTGSILYLYVRSVVCTPSHSVLCYTCRKFHCVLVHVSSPCGRVYRVFPGDSSSSLRGRRHLFTYVVKRMFYGVFY